MFTYAIPDPPQEQQAKDHQNCIHREQVPDPNTFKPPTEHAPQYYAQRTANRCPQGEPCIEWIVVCHTGHCQPQGDKWQRQECSALELFCFVLIHGYLSDTQDARKLHHDTDRAAPRATTNCACSGTMTGTPSRASRSGRTHGFNATPPTRSTPPSPTPTLLAIDATRSTTA